MNTSDGKRPEVTRRAERTVGIGIGTVLAVAALCLVCTPLVLANQFIFQLGTQFDGGPLVSFTINACLVPGVIVAIIVTSVGFAFSIGYRFGPRLFSRTASPAAPATASGIGEPTATAPQPTMDPRIVRLAPYMTTAGVGVVAGFIMGPLGGLAAGYVFASASPQAAILVLLTFPLGCVSGPIFGAVGAVLAALTPGQASKLLFHSESTTPTYAAGLIGGGLAAFLAGLVPAVAYLTLNALSV